MIANIVNNHPFIDGIFHEITRSDPPKTLEGSNGAHLRIPNAPHKNPLGKEKKQLRKRGPERKRTNINHYNGE
jgi:hypothetical protein